MYTFHFQIHTRVVDVGRSSLTLCTRLTNQLDGQVLATLTLKYVYVNRRSGKSASLPASLVDKLRPCLTSSVPATLPRGPLKVR